MSADTIGITVRLSAEEVLKEEGETAAFFKFNTELYKRRQEMKQSLIGKYVVCGDTKGNITGVTSKSIVITNDVGQKKEAPITNTRLNQLLKQCTTVRK